MKKHENQLAGLITIMTIGLAAANMMFDFFSLRVPAANTMFDFFSL